MAPSAGPLGRGTAGGLLLLPLLLLCQGLLPQCTLGLLGMTRQQQLDAAQTFLLQWLDNLEANSSGGGAEEPLPPVTLAVLESMLRAVNKTESATATAAAGRPSAEPQVVREGIPPGVACEEALWWVPTRLLLLLLRLLGLRGVRRARQGFWPGEEGDPTASTPSRGSFVVVRVCSCVRQVLD